MQRFAKNIPVGVFSISSAIMFGILAAYMEASPLKVLLMACCHTGITMFRDVTGKSLLFDTVSMFLVGLASNYFAQLGWHEKTWVNVVFILALLNGAYCAYLEITNARSRIKGDYVCKYRKG